MRQYLNVLRKYLSDGVSLLWSMRTWSTENIFVVSSIFLFVSKYCDVSLNHEECGVNMYVDLIICVLVRGDCIPSVCRFTWSFRLFLLHSLISLPLQHRNLKYALVAILRWLRRIVPVTFVSSMSLSLTSKNGSVLASHLYVHVFNFKTETHHSIFNAWLRYLTINYFETGRWNTEREAILFILYPSKLSFIDIEPIG